MAATLEKTLAAWRAAADAYARVVEEAEKVECWEAYPSWGASQEMLADGRRALAVLTQEAERIRVRLDAASMALDVLAGERDASRLRCGRATLDRSGRVRSGRAKIEDE